MKKFLLTFLIGLLCMGCASGPVTTASGKDKKLKTFPVMVGEKRVMDVKFQYLGKKPRGRPSGGGLTPDMMKDAHFYYYELVNLTDHTMEIFAFHSTGRLLWRDASGQRKSSPPRWRTRDELVRNWGITEMTIAPRGRKVHRDRWIVCGRPPCKIVYTYKIRILETDETFMVRIVTKG